MTNKLGKWNFVVFCPVVAIKWLKATLRITEMNRQYYCYMREMFLESSPIVGSFIKLATDCTRCNMKLTKTGSQIMNEIGSGNIINHFCL
jgi:hypothetical protein